MNANGLQNFAMHRQETPELVNSIQPMVGVEVTPPEGEPKIAALDPESAARRYLDEALAREDIPSFQRMEASGHMADFKVLGTETVPLTGTRTVKFRQVFQRIPVFGSIVTVEMNQNNELVSINSSLGSPDQVSPVAKISTAEVIDKIRQLAGYGDAPLDAAPRLYFYFEQETQRWRLVYLTVNVLKTAEATANTKPELVDYVIDAHSGELVAELPRTQGMEQPLVEPLRPVGRWRVRPPTGPVPEEALDGLGRRRKFLSKTVGNAKHLVDEAMNVHTFDFVFKDLRLHSGRLPGDYVTRPPEPWSAAGVSAHANAVEVAVFLREVLKRDNLDNRGGPIVSTINCLYGAAANREWRNAAWVGTQMVYGQRIVNGQLRSYAVALDVVAHEFLHGLTDHTARLVYAGMSGALNESYSDIFGIIVSNLAQPDLNKWNWEMGEDLEATGIPIRDFRDPPRRGQPGHMKDYVHLPNTRENDWGGVHINSGIHNKAAYHLLTAKGPKGNYLFAPKMVAALYYLALTQHLSRTSTFADSRRGVELAARSLFRKSPDQKRLFAAIASAFEAVGIVPERPSAMILS